MYVHLFVFMCKTLSDFSDLVLLCYSIIVQTRGETVSVDKIHVLFHSCACADKEWNSGQDSYACVIP